jgi:cytochrome P450
MTTLIAEPAARRTVPGPRQFFPLPIGPTILRAYQRDALGFYLGYHRRFGDVFRFRLGPFPLYAVRHPDLVQHVLEGRAEDYPRSKLYFLFELGVGKGLITTEGDFWRSHRRMADPGFDHRQVGAWAATTTEATAGLIERWRGPAAGGRPVEVFEEMLRLVLTILGRKVLGADIGAEGHAAGPAVKEMRDYINWRITHMLALPTSVPTPRNLRFRRALRTLHGFLAGLMAERRAEGKDHGDLLSLMMRARDGTTDAGLTDLHLRHEMLTFLLAGHEATASLLAWTWHELARHPDVEARLRAEVAEVLGGRVPTARDLAGLRYTRMVVQEALRLYPAVWMFTRDALRDDDLGGYRIPRGATVVLSPYVTHRHPEFWDDPERFDPERFAPGGAEGRHPYAYFPFCGGPHRCIAQDFVVMAAQLIVAMVAQAYRLHPVPGHAVEPIGTVIVSPRAGIPMTVRPA